MRPNAYPIADFKIKEEQVFDSWCAQCDGLPSRKVATYPMSAASRADRTATSLGEGAHTHYVARGDRLMVVVPTASRAA
ncbi:hypothetical protein [Streptomyces sp. NBC_01264]|uniref:hypothetical protein n=1 Tax=Streptomyces sp. NBC_01264 TaxID=2903804 RepID=UPI00225BB7C8|nr:hypothetical protein [Streptomyces sp. NBC_01264]MCX4781696.1 hypothetical protein [Streptomyces sp. NBC_01264]